MAWTNEQLAAMQKNSGNLLVAAGAGSGKTAVLIERIMGIITDLAQPVDVDRLLVLTYTNAAAAEMRQRLTQSLRERLTALMRNSDSEANVAVEHLTRQMVLLQRAKIMTIHAFCLDLLREYGYTLDLNAKSHIGSEGELNLLREKVLDDVFEAAYAEPDSGLRLLLRHYSRGLGDDNIRALVLRLIEFGQSMPDIEGWLSGLAAVYQQGQAENWLAYFAECLQDELADLSRLYQTAQNLAETSGLASYLPFLTQEAAVLHQAATLTATDGLSVGLAALAQLEFKRLPAVRKKDNPDPEAKECVQLLRKQVKDRVAALLREAAPIIHGTLAAELQEQAPLAEALINLTLNFYHAWQRAKRRRRLLEFADLEHYVLDLLQNEQLGVAASLQQRFFEIMVDEYQDINEVQERLLTLLSNGNNRFMVGDIKQSIYRFRLAEPGLFLQRFAAYGRGEGGRRVDLSRNFRSQSAILAGVNFVFSQLMSGGNLEINYDEAAMLHCGRPELPACPVELLIIDKSALQAPVDSSEWTKDAAPEDIYNKEETENRADLPDDQPLNNWLADMHTAELEAQVLAQKIQQEHEQGRDWQDMVILLRAVRAWAPTFSRVLRSWDIPCQTDGYDDFLSLPEVQVVCSLLAVFDNPRQDIALASVLHSPLVGLSLAELADLHILNPSSLYLGLTQSHDGRLLQFVQHLAEWRRRSQELGVADLLVYLYNATALPELLGLLPGSRLRRRNLRELQRLAGEYDAAGGIGLGRFLKFLAAGKQHTAATDTAVEAVRLMSIHKSKGLEFPVVFVAGLGTSFNEEDFRRDILLHRNLGLGMRRVDLVGRRKYPTFGFNIIARKSRWESLAEMLRLLYVAMTRAEHKLYLVGTINSLLNLVNILAGLSEEEDGSTGVSAGFLIKNRSFLPWLCAALMRHPDGQILRNLNRYQYIVCEQAGVEGRWHLEFIDSLDALDKMTKNLALAEKFDFDAWLGSADDETAADEAIAGALTRSYAAADLAKLPVKWSVTAFKRLLPLPEAALDANEVMQNQLIAEEFAENLQETAQTRPEKSGGQRTLEWYAAYGRMVHELLQKADLGALADMVKADNSKAALAAVAAYLQELLAELSAGCTDESVSRAAAKEPAVLAKFFLQPLGRRMLASYQQQAGQVLREQRFVAGLKLADLAALGVDLAAWLGLHGQTPNLAGAQLEQETVFLQGVLDLAFAEPDGWVLVDYKSGANRNKSAEQVREEYGLQLAVYRWALQRACGQPVKEGYVYFTANARVVRLF